MALSFSEVTTSSCTVWRYRTGGIVNSSPAIGRDDTVFIGSNDFNVYALNGLTGALKWNYTTRGAVSNAPIASDGTVIVASGDFHIYALNGSTGVLIWSYNVSWGTHWQ